MKGCLVILALLALAMWWGYRKMASVASGPPPDVTIHAPASRVFASLANGDSIPTWMGRGNVVLVSRHGMVLPGDTISVQLRRAFGGRFERIRWIVSAVVPDKLVVLEVRSDTTGTLLGTRRDSLISMGDSTRVVSNVVVALPDSIRRAAKSDTGTKGSADAMIDMTSRMIFSAFRMESKLDLTRLKTRIESGK
ncbi:MAG TPA: hypothetical protein VNC11_14460 [Gemmatimonadaceae bacterium]|nr:hypothetical protein [Gemmatimonadaceae bacterium]